MNFDFARFEASVRTAEEQNETDIIQYYVHWGLHRAKCKPCQATTKQAHMRIVNTLLEALCDDLLPSEYRKRCYKMICMLKPILFELLDQEGFAQFCLKTERYRAYFLSPFLKMSNKTNLQSDQ